jgi:hypothetical protein
MKTRVDNVLLAKMKYVLNERAVIKLFKHIINGNMGRKRLE